MKIKSTSTKNRAEAYRRYDSRVQGGYQNPLDPAGPRHRIHATHIDRYGMRYDLSPMLRINQAIRARQKRLPHEPIGVPVYRPSKRQVLEGCDACGPAHVHTNIYCLANAHCVRTNIRLDANCKFRRPVSNTGIPETLHSLVPGRYPTYKALVIEIHIIGKYLHTSVAF